VCFDMTLQIRLCGFFGLLLSLRAAHVQRQLIGMAQTEGLTHSDSLCFLVTDLSTFFFQKDDHQY